MADLVTVAKDVVSSLARRDLAAVFAIADKMFTAGITEFVLGESWTQIVRQAGEFKSIEGTRPFRFLLGPVRVVFVTCKFQRMPVEIEVSFNAEGRIIGLVFMTPGHG